MKRNILRAAPALLLGSLWAGAHADESLLGYIKGAEVMPKGAIELDQTLTYRSDKGRGDYDAWNSTTEIEYGATDRFTVSAELKLQALDTEGLIIDGYLPKAKDYGPKPSGVEASGKYMFLSPAKDPIGLALVTAFSYDWLDPHSGQDKDTLSLENTLVVQKYFMEGQLVAVFNAGLETTFADRHNIAVLPPGFDWPTKPEMEIEVLTGAGLSYRFMPNWYIGVETLYETEYETEVGQERWTLFAGPSLHYGGSRFWATVTWFPQVVGGGERYVGQSNNDLHLIEKTKSEVRMKVGFEF